MKHPFYVAVPRDRRIFDKPIFSPLMQDIERYLSHMTEAPFLITSDTTRTVGYLHSLISFNDGSGVLDACDSGLFVAMVMLEIVYVAGADV